MKATCGVPWDQLWVGPREINAMHRGLCMCGDKGEMYYNIENNKSKNDDELGCGRGIERKSERAITGRCIGCLQGNELWCEWKELSVGNGWIGRGGGQWEKGKGGQGGGWRVEGRK